MKERRVLTPRVPASSGAVAFGRLQVWALPPLSAQPHGGHCSPQAWPQKSRQLSFNTRIAQHCCRGGPSPRWVLWGILQVKCSDFCRANVSHHLGEHRFIQWQVVPIHPLASPFPGPLSQLGVWYTHRVCMHGCVHAYTLPFPVVFHGDWCHRT